MMGERAVQTTLAAGAITETDANFLLKNLKVIKDVLPQRFYPVLIEPKKKDNKNKDKDKDKDGDADVEMEDKKVEEAQIWVIRFGTSAEQVKARNALWALHADDTLSDLMDAFCREDRAPMGSMAKNLAEAMRGSKLED